MMTITKSNYISCKQCEKLLWLEKYKPHVLDDKVTKQTAQEMAQSHLVRMLTQDVPLVRLLLLYPLLVLILRQST